MRFDLDASEGSLPMKAPGRWLGAMRPLAGGRRSIVLLGAAVAIVGVAAAIGGAGASGGRTGLYEELNRPGWAPPGGVFGPVWTVLYVTMAAASWLVAREGLERSDVRVALGLFTAQLALNAAWTPIFFGAGQVSAAAIEIVALAVVLAATVVAFWRTSRLAGALMVPYLAWVIFAAALNIAIALAQPDH
jgi:benzodiazapine receptor